MTLTELRHIYDYFEFHNKHLTEQDKGIIKNVLIKEYSHEEIISAISTMSWSSSRGVYILAAILKRNRIRKANSEKVKSILIGVTTNFRDK